MTRRLITVTEAARRLKVQGSTVRVWVRNGRLKGIVGLGIRKGIRKNDQRFAVYVDSLKDARKVNCLWCGNVFRSKHPKQARYCCRKHKDRYLYTHRGDPSINRFKRRKTGQ